jgi:hypothetical protein
MPAPTAVLSTVPAGLRDPLLVEYDRIVQNYMERRWTSAELSGGLFSEIVYTILDGHAKGTYAAKPSKPNDMVSACRTLEKNKHVPRSFQILIPRTLPALYEVRNQRGVGHTGGDVDSNHMDSNAVLAMTSWIMAELVRVFHNLPVDEAQTLVDNLVERRTPLIWQSGNMKRVLDPTMLVKDQIMVLVASAAGEVSVDDLMKWIGYSKTNKTKFKGIIRALHSKRHVEFDDARQMVQILPPGAIYASTLFPWR